MPISAKTTRSPAALPPRLLLALAAILAIAFSATAVRAADAGAAGCSRPTLGTATRALVNGESVVVGGTACGRARILVGAKGHWRPLGTARPGARGHFKKRLRLDVPNGVTAVVLKAVSARRASPRLRIRVEHRHPVQVGKPAPVTGGGTGSPAPVRETKPIRAPESPAAPTPAPEPTPAPAPEPPAAPESPVTPETPAPEAPRTPEAPTPPEQPEAPGQRPCALAASVTTGPLGMTIPTCAAVASDTVQASSPLGFWGSIDCANQSRQETIASGGDAHVAATGEPANGSYRRLTVLDGDNVYGERCELGYNNHGGPTAFYREGEHRVTYYSERLPSNFPLSTSKWQTVMQMKQAEPQHDGNTGVALEMEARQSSWVVDAHWNQVWKFPAQAGVWTRFAWDVYYSGDPNKGWLQVSADLNNDGDFDDPGERSPVIHTATMATEIAGYPGDGVAVGTGIPSHLRVGVYHDPAIACPQPTGCSIDVDNVQVVAP